MNLSEKEQVTGGKLTGFAMVVILHVLLAYAILTGLGRTVIKLAVQEIPITLNAPEISPPKAPKPEPPKPKMDAAPKPAEIPKPEISTSESPSPIAPTSADTSDQTTGQDVVSAVVDFGSCQKPEYPSGALRNHETGTSRLMFLIGPDGSIAESKVQASSGHRSLDAAALSALSLCKFKPGTINGQPQSTWASVDYVWKMQD